MSKYPEHLYGIFQSRIILICHFSPDHTSTPHETREANVMRTRQNIDIMHYELDSTGKPVTIDYYPGAIEGKLSANQQNVYVMITRYSKKFMTLQ